MKPRYLLWQKRMKEHPYFIGEVVAVTVIVFFFLSYRLSWDWTGFNGADKTDKTLYDWLQLVLVPLALTVFGFYLNYREKNKEEQRIEKEQKEEARRVTYEKKLADERAEEELKLEQQRAQTGHEIAEDNQREAAFQAYINEMAELLLHEHLRDSNKDDEVRSIARVRTVTVLRRLDADRKGSLVSFLHQSGLIMKEKPVINLSQANLREANLELTILDHADLSGADLSGAHICSSYCRGSSFRSCNLSDVDLTGTELIEANLEHATGISVEQLEKAKSLKGATMPDGSIHP